jgi:hypothetical protein
MCANNFQPFPQQTFFFVFVLFLAIPSNQKTGFFQGLLMCHRFETGGDLLEQA